MSRSIKYKENGKIDTSVDANIDIEKGMYFGFSISLTESMGSKLEPTYGKWSVLNSHVLTLGTTRQGKTRAMAADIEQQIALGANTIVEEPKGSIGNEMYGYLCQFALKHNRTQDLLYVSPYYKEYSEIFNAIYGYKNEQIASLVADIIEAKDAFYANIAKAIVINAAMGLEFLEEVNKIKNPYDLIIMDKIEHAKVLTKTTNRFNKYIFADDYSEKKHGVSLDVVSMLIRDNPMDEELIKEAYERTKLRYEGKGISDVEPLRKFITLRDFAQFETMQSLQILYDKVLNTYDEIEHDPAYTHLKRMGIEARGELEKISKRDEGFFSKVTTTYSTLMTDLIAGDVGYVLNESRINIVTDRLRSDTKKAILFIQPFPMIYKSASTALGKIFFNMISGIAGYTGVSGEELKTRTYLNIDEAGSVLTRVVQELANKGGGLGVSLNIFTQSMADIEDTLDSVGARIFNDNMNTIRVFKGNDTESLAMISEKLGTKKTAGAMGTSSSNRDTRVVVSVKDEDIATGALISQLDARKFILKLESEIYLVQAPHVDDCVFKIKMPIKSGGDLSAETDVKIQNSKDMLL